MAKKTETAAAEKSAAAKKTTAKAAPKAAAKKAAPAKKAAAPAKKTSAAKEVAKIQFDGCEFDVAEVVEKAKADYKANNKAAVKTVTVYIKPEEKAAYYVVNDKVQGKVDL